MTLTLELTLGQEQQIEAEARHRNLDAASYAKTLLFKEGAAENGDEQALPPAAPLRVLDADVLIDYLPYTR